MIAIKAIAKWLADWWRGYSERDWQSLQAKMAAATTPGAIVLITKREWKALLYCKRGRSSCDDISEPR